MIIIQNKSNTEQKIPWALNALKCGVCSSIRGSFSEFHSLVLCFLLFQEEVNVFHKHSCRPHGKQDSPCLPPAAHPINGDAGLRGTHKTNNDNTRNPFLRPSFSKPGFVVSCLVARVVSQWVPGLGLLKQAACNSRTLC